MADITLDYLREIGRGTYGEIWESRCRATGRSYAVKKFLCPENSAEDIERELKPLLTLRHDNLVKGFGWLFHDDTLHGVFELLHHDVMDEILRNPRGLPSDVLRRYTYQILRAVAFLHSVNIAHRDIKPDNVLVSSSGVIKLADLGMSLKADSIVEPCQVKGSFPYAAPELFLRVCDSYKHSDVWAVGCTILAMAKGRVHFIGIAGVLFNIVKTVGPLTQQQLSNFKVCFPSRTLPIPAAQSVPLTEKYRVSNRLLAEVMEGCLKMEPNQRASCDSLLNYEYFTAYRFNERFLVELDEMVARDLEGNSGQSRESQLFTNQFPLEVSSHDSVLIDKEELDDDGEDGEMDESTRLSSADPENEERPMVVVVSGQSREPSSEVSSHEVTGSCGITMKPAVLIDKEELDEDGEDGEVDESTRLSSADPVNEERPAEEEVRRKRGFRAAIRRTLSTIRRFFSFGCCRAGPGGDRRQGAGEELCSRFRDNASRPQPSEGHLRMRANSTLSPPRPPSSLPTPQPRVG